MHKTLATGSRRHIAAVSGQRPNGFTLVELLVVVMIVLLLAGSLPLALDRTLPARRVSAKAQELALAIRQLQTEAAISGRPVHLAVQGNAYVVRRAEDHSEIRHVVGDHIALILTSMSNGAPIRELVLYPDGSASGARLSLQQGRHNAAVEVSHLSGRVKVSS